MECVMRRRTSCGSTKVNFGAELLLLTPPLLLLFLRPHVMKRLRPDKGADLSAERCVGVEGGQTGERAAGDGRGGGAGSSSTSSTHPTTPWVLWHFWKTTKTKFFGETKLYVVHLRSVTGATGCVFGLQIHDSGENHPFKEKPTMGFEKNAKTWHQNNTARRWQTTMQISMKYDGRMK